MRIAITGSTGLIGQAVCTHFRRAGNTVIHLVRPSSKYISADPVITWDPAAGVIDASALEGMDAVIHLAGASIAGARWTPHYKEVIRASRVAGTRFLSETIARLKSPPKVLLSASAVGFYGDVASPAQVDESAGRGRGFLADVCAAWEQETAPAQKAGIRVVHMRFGMALSAKGGALAKMLPVFRMGLGGTLASGDQMMSWIAVAEIPLVMQYLINMPGLTGPVNIVAPNPVSNAVFTRILAGVLKRPAVLPVPAFAVKMLFGEMGESLLLDGAAVFPSRLNAGGYVFRYPDLKSALEACLP